MGVKSVILVFFKSTTQIFADEPFFWFIFLLIQINIASL